MANERYRHYKGGLYDLVGLAWHSETGEAFMVYRSVETGVLWIRPEIEWAEPVPVNGQPVPRFSAVEGGTE